MLCIYYQLRKFSRLAGGGRAAWMSCPAPIRYLPECFIPSYNGAAWHAQKVKNVIAATPIDLHMHTYYSDGRPSPQALIAEAARIGLTTIAITDHDNARGSREARPLAEAAGITLIPAVEVTCAWEGVDREVDLLGYFVDFDSPAFQRLEQTNLADLEARIRFTCDRIAASGVPICMEDVLAQNPRYGGGMQLIQAVQRITGAPDFRTALETVRPQLREMPPACLPITEAIAAIRAAGGVAALAHPTLVGQASGFTAWIDAALLGQLVDAGLGGIEVFHPRVDGPAREHFSALARQFGLVITGGSDEHGWPDGFPALGRQPITRHMLDALRERASTG
jgi:hypothetical protein